MKNYYGRCIECGLKYKNRSDVPKIDCPKCGNNMRILNPADDVYIRASWAPLMELCAYALKFAVGLVDLNEFLNRHAPRAIKAIRGRLVAQRQKGVVSAAINWHELELLGWWASQYLSREIYYNPKKLMGPCRRITEYLVDLSLFYPGRAPLSGTLKLAIDEVGAWLEENDKAKTLTADQVNSFPSVPTEAEVDAIEKAKRKINPRIILGSNGKELNTLGEL